MKSIITVQQNEQEPQKFAFAIREMAQRFGNFSWTNFRQPITALYTVANSDKGNTLALGGSAFYTLTFAAASGYDADFGVMVVNEDTGRAKTIAPNGLSSFLLYPGQSVIVYNQNNVWHVQGQSRWKLTANTTINVNSSVGNDANDGLATGAGNAKATVIAALYQIANDFDYLTSQSAQPVVTILMGANDTTGVHFGLYAPVGGASGGDITLDGGGFSISNGADTDDALHMFFGTGIYLKNITIVGGTNHGGLNLEKGARAFLFASVVFAATGGGTQIQVQDGSDLEIESTGYSVSGGTTAAGIHALFHHGGRVRFPAAATISFTANATFGWTVLALTGGIADFTNASFNLNGHTVTAKRWEADNMGLVISNAGSPDTFFPGNVNGTTSGGGNGV